VVRRRRTSREGADRVKSSHRQAARVALTAAKAGKPVVLIDRRRSPRLVAQDVRTVAKEMGMKVSVRVAGQVVEIKAQEGS
jgi:hypothetical protein